MKWIQYKHMVLPVVLLVLGIDEEMNTILVSYRIEGACVSW